MEHAGAGPGEAAAGGRAVPQACATASPRARCCISARASGIPASSCRAGRSAATGARTAEPIWRDPHLYALESKPVGATPEIGASLCAGLRASGCSSIPATCSRRFEDTWYYLWRERRLPSNVAVDTGQGEGPELERERLARIFEQGLESSVGSCCRSPRDHVAQAGERARRPLAQRAVVPALGEVLPDPGDSAARLPPAARFAALGGAGRTPTSSPSPTRWSPHPDLPPLDAFRRAPVLRRQERGLRCRRLNGDGEAPPRGLASARWRPISAGGPASAHSAAGIVRTAISVRAARRPPLRLHAAGRAHSRTISTWSPRSRTPPRNSASRSSSRAIRRPAAIRGCCNFSVTPDPGVIEVNIHPSASWQRARRHAPRSSTRRRARPRLGAQKFMIDGRHTGTGGGNHVVLGGPSAADPPARCAGPIC